MAQSTVSSNYPFPAIAGYLAAHGPITVTINMKLLQVGGVRGRGRAHGRGRSTLSPSIPHPAELPEGCDQGHTHHL